MLYFNYNSPFDNTWIVFNTIYNRIEGKGKMSQKSVTLVTILTIFFHVILERNILKPWNSAWCKKTLISN